MKRTIASLVLCAFGTGCMPTMIDPPAAPEARLPDVSDVTPPPQPDRVPVVIEAVEGPAMAYRTLDESSHLDDRSYTINTTTRVYDQHGNWVDTRHGTENVIDFTYTHSLDLEALCVSPCVAWLPKGTHSLHLTPLRPMKSDGLALQDTPVTVTAKDSPIAVRVKLNAENEYDHGFAGIALLVLGGMGVVGGAIATPFSLTRSPEDGDAQGWLVGGLVSAGVGAAFMLIGGLLAAATRGTKRPSSVTKWALPNGTF